MFQGNNVRDENSEVALFSELGSSPATMEAGTTVDAYGAQPVFDTEQADGKQAYTQALMKGLEAWVEFPRDRWPKSWVASMRDRHVDFALLSRFRGGFGSSAARRCWSLWGSRRLALSVFPR